MHKLHQIFVGVLIFNVVEAPFAIKEVEGHKVSLSQSLSHSKKQQVYLGTENWAKYSLGLLYTETV